MREARVRWPSLVIGLVFAVICCAFTPYNNVKLQNSPLAGGHFPLASFGCLFLLLVLVNPVLSLVRKSWRLRFHELLLIWSMVTAATGVAFTGLMRTFLINITTPEWLVMTAGNVGRRLSPLLPAGLFPKDPLVVRPLYSGIEGGLDMTWWEVFTRVPWAAWVMPLCWWGLFMVMVYAALLGLVGLFSHQWIENEKMNFPLLRVPEVLSEESESGSLLRYFTHSYFLIGFSIPLLLHLLNGLHTYFPEVPQVPTLILAQPYIPREGLLSGFYKTKIYIYPAFIGFAFLASKQISFSLWSFFLMGGLLPGLLQVVGWRLPAAALGTSFGPGLAKVEEMQMIGASAVFFLFIVWLARDYLRLVLLSFLRLRRGIEDAHGLLSPRTSLALFLAGFAGVTAWLTFMGMDLFATFLFMIVCFVVQLVSARLICQCGLPYYNLAIAPSDGFLTFLDTRLIAPLTLYLGAVVEKMTFLDLREAAAPSFFHASKASDGSRPANRFLWGIAWAVVVGAGVSFVAMLVLYYKFGISSLPDDWAVETTRRVHENVAELLARPEQSKHWSMLFAFIGAAVMALLVTGYHAFIWWPLHPIGYLTTYSAAMQILWFGFFIGWLCNTLVLRYGGVNRFNEVRRLFIGMIVGDLTMALAWLIVGIFTPISYHVLPL